MSRFRNANISRSAVTCLVATCLAISVGRVRGEPHRVVGNEPGGAVFGLGDKGAFDAKWATCPTVLRENGVYRMWYSSLCDANDGPGGIGLATSRDGIAWSRQNGGKAVLEVGPRGALDDGQVMGPHVLRVGDRYLMWYTGMPTRRHESGFGYYRIFLASSPDGLTWTRENGGNPVLDLGPADAPDSVQVATPVVLRDGAGFRMWYAAWSPTSNHTICTARSDDGLKWIRENNGQPVTGLSPTTAYGHAVARVGDEYLLLYMSLDKQKGLYAASSTDGQNWRMQNNGKPVLTPGAAGTFDDLQLGHADITVDADKLRVWYTGYTRTSDKQLPLRLTIGLAESRLEELRD